MKTIRFIVFSTILLILAGGLFSCNGKEKPPELHITEYSLEGTSSKWVNLHYDTILVTNERNEAQLKNYLVVITDEVQLRNYITGNDFPAIDFSKHTLLLVHGWRSFELIEDLAYELQEHLGKYVLNMEMTTTSFVGRNINWRVALLVNRPKILVELDIHETVERFISVNSIWGCEYNVTFYSSTPPIADMSLHGFVVGNMSNELKIRMAEVRQRNIENGMHPLLVEIMRTRFRFTNRFFNCGT
jgi:hypothetical protein